LIPFHADQPLDFLNVMHEGFSDGKSGQDGRTAWSVAFLVFERTWETFIYSFLCSVRLARRRQY